MLNKFDLKKFVWLILILPATAFGQGGDPDSVSFRGRTLPLYPEKIAAHPEVPSPFTSDEGIDVLIAHTLDDSA